MGKFCCRTGCSEMSKYVCSRCRAEYYCSKTCQVDSFISHRKFCFELPSLDEITDEDNISASMQTLHLTKSADSTPSVLNIHDQPKNTEDESNKITAAFNAGTRTNPPPSCKDTVLTVPNPVKKYVVDEHQHQKEQSEAKEIAGLKNLRQSHQELAKSQEKPENPIRGDQKTDQPKRIMVNELKMMTLPRKAKVFVVEKELDNKVYHVYEFSEHVEAYLAKIDAAIIDFAKKSKIKSYKPVEGEVILAMLDDKYYRAVCKSLDDDGVTVKLLDYGDTSKAKENEIMPIDQSLIFDVVISPCHIPNFPDELTLEQADNIMIKGVQVDEVAKSSDGKSYSAKYVGI